MSEESMIYPGKMLGELAIALEKLGWEYGDEVDVEIGGTAVSGIHQGEEYNNCLLYTSPSPRDRQKSRMPSSA